MDVVAILQAKARSVVSWTSHFSLQNGRITGLSDVGRTTVEVLNRNAPERIRLRVLFEPEFFVK